MSVCRVWSLFFIFCACCFAGENLIVNPEMTGTPLRPWRGNAFTVRDGVAVLTAAGGKNADIWQPMKNPVKGKKYLHSVMVKGTPGSEYRFCAFWPAKIKGKSVSQCSDNWKKRKAGSAWEKVEVSFLYPEEAVRAPYLSVVVYKGTVEIRNMALVQSGEKAAESAAVSENLVVNPVMGGTPPRPWRGERFSIRDGVAVLDAADGKIASIWQPMKNPEKGLSYRHSVMVKGTPGSEYRFCAFWPAKINGKSVSQCSDSWKKRKGTGQWQKIEMEFLYPQEAVRTPYLSVTAYKGTVEVKEMAIGRKTAAVKKAVPPAVNLIVNPKMTGNPPRPWRGSGFAIKDGVAVLTAAGGRNADIWQPMQNPVKGKKYRHSVMVKGTPGSEYRFCAFWPAKINGKTVPQCSDNWKKRKGTGQWQKIEEIFLYPKEAARTPYLSVIVFKGSVEIKEMAISEYSAEGGSLGLNRENMLGNPQFAGTPLRPWRGERFAVQDGVAVLTADKGGVASIWQPLQRAVRGDRYLHSAMVKGTPGSEYRLCVYWPAKIGGKTVPQCSDNWKKRHATGDWQKQEQSFFFSEEALRLPYVAVIVYKGTVSVKDMSVVRLASPSQLANSLGGHWKLHETASVGTESGQDFPKVAAVSIHVPGAELTRVPVQAGKKYILEYQVKGFGVSGRQTGFHNYRLEVRADGYCYRMPWEDVWTQDWQRKKLVLDRLPEGLQKISFRFYSGSRGQVGFRNLALKEYIVPEKKTVALEMIQPVYRNAVYASLPVPEISAMIRDDKKQWTGRIRLEKDGKVIAEKDCRAEVPFSFQIEKLPLGKYTLTAVQNSNHSGAALTQVIYKYPPAPHEVIQGPGRNIYVDGKPFLPIVPMQIPGGDDGLALAAANGINASIHYVGQEQAALLALETARKAGMYAVFGIRYCEDGNLPAWRSRVERMLSAKVLGHPALLGYFLADEPLWVGANLHDITQSYQFLREMDPYHPVWINSAPLSSIDDNRPYCRAADVNGIDIYPIPYPTSHSSLEDKYPTCVGKYTRNIMEASDNRKSIWMVLQGTTWPAMSRRKGSLLEGYPSRMELRFMAYDAFFNGANGLSYYGLPTAVLPEFFRDWLAANREFHQVSSLLLEGRRQALPAPEGMEFIRITLKDSSFLFVKNNTNRKRSAAIPGEKGSGTLKVLFENRSLALQKDSFQDEFPPFSVHVYGNGSLPAPFRALPVWKGKTDPFQEHCRQDGKPDVYQGKACWIWDRDKARKQGNSAVMMKSFLLDKVPESAVMMMAADDYAEIFVNGSRVGVSLGWQQMVRLDLKPYLKTGENIIRVAAMDSGHLPCGFLADIEMVTADGTRRKMLSDESWSGVSGHDGKQVLKPVAVIAPYGKGAWMNRVQMPKK